VGGVRAAGAGEVPPRRTLLPGLPAPRGGPGDPQESSEDSTLRRALQQRAGSGTSEAESGEAAGHQGRREPGEEPGTSAV
jgi:hypothetical protein